MFPFFPLNPATLIQELETRMQRVELAQVQSLKLMHSLLKHLESKLGSEFITDELKTFAATKVSDFEDFANELNELLDNYSQRPQAVRRYRDMTGATWDEAQAFINGWKYRPFRANSAGIQLAAWLKTINPSESDTEPQGPGDGGT